MCWKPSISICSFQGFGNHLENCSWWPRRSDPISPLGRSWDQVSGTTWCRNWSTPSWPLWAAKCAGNCPIPSAVFKVSGTISWKKWSTSFWPCSAAQCARNFPFLSAVLKVSGTTWVRNWSTPSWPFWAAQCAGNHPSPFAAFKVSGTTLKTAADGHEGVIQFLH